MIILANKTYQLNSLHLDTNWLEYEDSYIVDETTEEGKIMAQTYIDNYPFVDFEHDGEFVTKVIVLDKPERLPDIEGKEIQLIKNDQDEWEYIYVDNPKTQEELQQEVINTLGQELAVLKIQLIMKGVM